MLRTEPGGSWRRACPARPAGGFWLWSACWGAGAAAGLLGRRRGTGCAERFARLAEGKVSSFALSPGPSAPSGFSHTSHHGNESRVPGFGSRSRKSPASGEGVCGHISGEPGAPGAVCSLRHLRAAAPEGLAGVTGHTRPVSRGRRSPTASW